MVFKKGSKHKKETIELMKFNHKKPWLGKTMSEDIKEKKREAMKKWWKENRDNPETLKRNEKIGKNRKGIMHTEETKQILREMRLGKTVSEETKEAVRKAQTGKIVSEETKNKMSIARKGKPLAESAKEKLSMIAKEKWKDKTYKSEFSKSRQGENNPNYRGGIQYEPYDDNWSKSFRHSIRERDNQVCMNCGKHREKLKTALDVHHINYDKQLSIKENCISLCHSCHSLTQINREYWTKLFYDKLAKLYEYKYTDHQIELEFLKGGVTKYVEEIK